MDETLYAGLAISMLTLLARGKHSRPGGFAFVPNPKIYASCRPSQLSDYVAYKSARRMGPFLPFLDIHNQTSPISIFPRNDGATKKADPKGARDRRHKEGTR